MHQQNNADTICKLGRNLFQCVQDHAVNKAQLMTKVKQSIVKGIETEGLGQDDKDYSDLEEDNNNVEASSSASAWAGLA